MDLDPDSWELVRDIDSLLWSRAGGGAEERSSAENSVIDLFQYLCSPTWSSTPPPTFYKFKFDILNVFHSQRPVSLVCLLFGCFLWRTPKVWGGPKYEKRSPLFAKLPGRLANPLL